MPWNIITASAYGSLLSDNNNVSSIPSAAPAPAAAQAAPGTEVDEDYNLAVALQAHFIAEDMATTEAGFAADHDAAAAGPDIEDDLTNALEPEDMRAPAPTHHEALPEFGMAEDDAIAAAMAASLENAGQQGTAAAAAPAGDDEQDEDLVQALRESLA